MPHIGEIIARIIDEKHFTKKEVADKAGLSADGLSRIIHGRTKHPRRYNIERIAKALQIDVDSLLKGPESEASMGRAIPGTIQAPPGISNYIPQDAGKEEATLQQALAIITLKKHILTGDEFEHSIEIIRKILQNR